MKYDVTNYSDVAIESTTVEKDITLSKDNQTLIFQMFSKNIYSNPIGSVVREITSNCFDSHIEAKVTAPVIIRKTIDNQTNSTSISFIDFGVGMSPSRINDVFSVMFSSTKRDDNEQIGAFGLGSKPLAYKRSTGLGQGEYDNAYFLITNYDGIKYSYQIYEGNSSPKISLLHSEPTKEGNGTEVRIPVLEKDMESFKKEMVRQLYYFEDIIFEGFDDEYNSNDKILSNEYQIVRAKSFLFRGAKYSSYAHVCLGRVAYPIDYSALGLNQGDFCYPIALRLEVGEINVTVSRESLDYSENTIKVLKKKLIEAKEEIMSALVKQYTNVVTLEDYFNTKNDFGVLSMPNGESIRISDVKMKDFDFTNFKYNFTKIPDDSTLFRFFFENRLYGKKENRRKSNTDSFRGSYKEIKEADNVYYFEGVFERKIIKQAWLKSQHNRYYTVTKKDVVNRWMRSDVADVFSVSDRLVNDDDLTLTAFGQSLLELQDEYFEIIKNNFDDYNTIEVPEDFKIARKSSSITKEIRNTTIPIKFGDSSRSYRVKLDALFNLKCPIFYATKDNERLLDESAVLFKFLFDDNTVLSSYDEYRNKFGSQTKQIMFIRIAQGNIKYMEHCFNAKPVSEFKHKYIHRKANAILEFFQSANFVSKYYDIEKIYRDKSFSKLSSKWVKKIEVVKTYVNRVNTSHRDWDNNRGLLAKYYSIDDIKNTKEQEKYIKVIDEVLEMQKLNADVLQHINIPYGSLEYADDTLIGILKKIMVY